MIIKEFSIENFRCFKHFEIKGLNRLNLFAGKNNVGKTAFLEALFLYCGSFNPELIMRINAFRGLELVKFELVKREYELPWNSIFYNFETDKSIILKGQTKTREKKVYITTKIEKEDYQTILSYIKPLKEMQYPTFSENYPIIKLNTIEGDEERVTYMILTPLGLQIISFPSPPIHFPTIYLSSKMRSSLIEDAERFSELARIREQKLVSEALRILEPKLRDLTILTVANVPILHGEMGTGRFIPLPLMGEGMVKIASLILAIASAKEGIVLIDELENGLHYSVLIDVWKAIAYTARKFNCQVFATTHSFECIKSAHLAFSEDETYDFSFYRLEKFEEKIIAKLYDKETLEATFEIGLEVR
ncbi:MAG: AAA family ATPase [Thermodesulfovibrio sp.]|nr:AAA family ATPase [Thermodesulfovibrio sp.]